MSGFPGETILASPGPIYCLPDYFRPYSPSQLRIKVGVPLAFFADFREKIP